ncbi:MAG: mitochondrial fission ELM1 family protein, partial [Candidatus Omnitrophica bacterium]|nr:mitochondrial fission ELM1 family protein [Candidatus Omnitrophota bacterium]
FGNWELSGIVSSLKGFPLYVLAREQRMKRLNGLINRLRESKGLKVVRKGITTRYIIKVLHENKLVGMVTDQDAGKDGVTADFFGRPVSTASGPYRLASRTGAVILPTFMVRIKGPYHRLVIEKPVKIEREVKNLLPFIQRYNNLLQSYVGKYYDQWLWLHRRWKSTPLKKIVILSDGKSGHLNQSLSLAESFKRYRQASGIKQNNLEVEIIEVRFKNRFLKALINITSIFSGPWCQGCLGCLRFALRKSSYEKLAHTYADVVISTGFSLAGINSVYKFENNAKNAVCMKPGNLGFKKFDMVVLPRHDVRKSIRRKNVIITDTSPNIINNNYLEKAKIAVSGMIKKENARIFRVLLGGDNADFEYTQRDISKAISQILDASNRMNADILFTTSRRTARNIENIVKEKLGKEARCKFLVIANERNIPYAVGGILALSDIIVVSGESTSMVSEAVSSGKRIAVFKGKKKKSRVSKHERFLDRLLDAGYLEIAEPENLSDIIYNISKVQTSSKKGDNGDWIYRNMWRLGA